MYTYYVKTKRHNTTNYLRCIHFVIKHKDIRAHTGDCKKFKVWLGSETEEWKCNLAGLPREPQPQKKWVLCF